MKDKKIIFFPIFIILIIVLVIVLSLNNNKENLNKIDTVEDIINNIFYSDKTTRSDLERVMATPILGDFIFIGKDSAIRSKPTSSEIKSNKLTNYEKEQNKYVKKVEKRFKEQGSYTVKENKDGILEFEIKPWYYYNYSSDLGALTVQILEDSNYDLNRIQTKPRDFLITSYKAKIVAMRIMDNYLSNYDNETGEVRYLNFYFDGNNPKVNEYFSLYLNMAGVTSDYSPEKDKNYENIQKNRIMEYLEYGKENGLYNEKNPLKL